MPVGERGHDQAINVREDRGHRLAVFGRCGGQLLNQIARLDLREHGPLIKTREVVADPINELMPVAPELFNAHVAERRREPLRRVVCSTHARHLTATQAAAHSSLLTELFRQLFTLVLGERAADALQIFVVLFEVRELWSLRVA